MGPSSAAMMGLRSGMVLYTGIGGISASTHGTPLSSLSPDLVSQGCFLYFWCLTPFSDVQWFCPFLNMFPQSCLWGIHRSQKEQAVHSCGAALVSLKQLPPVTLGWESWNISNCLENIYSMVFKCYTEILYFEWGWHILSSLRRQHLLKFYVHIAFI